MSDSQAISNFMTKTVYSIERNRTLNDAIKIMYSKGIHHLPIMKDGILFGLLSDRDAKLAKAVLPADRANAITVEEVCNQDPYVAQADEPLNKVAEEMLKRQIGSALIAKNGLLAGIFTVTDALQVIVKMSKS